MRVLHVASEVYPLIKTGGLADVAAALPAALMRIGVDARILVPGYPAVLDKMSDLRHVRTIADPWTTGGAALMKGRTPDGVTCYVIDAPEMYGRPGNPYLVPRAKVMAHRFQDSCIYSQPGADPYWRDVGTVDAYWEANLDLTKVTPDLNLYDRSWPIFTYQEQLPPAKFVFNSDDRRGMAVDSLVSGGCIISGARIQDSLLFSSVRANSYSSLDQTVVLPQCEIGRFARLTKAVVDRGCRIPDHLVVGEDPDEDARRFYRTESGVTLITREMISRLAG